MLALKVLSAHPHLLSVRNRLEEPCSVCSVLGIEPSDLNMLAVDQLQSLTLYCTFIFTSHCRFIPPLISTSFQQVPPCTSLCLFYDLLNWVCLQEHRLGVYLPGQLNGWLQHWRKWHLFPLATTANRSSGRGFPKTLPPQHDGVLSCASNHTCCDNGHGMSRRYWLSLNGERI